MIEAIVLAAGLAIRMGEIKPLMLVEGDVALARILRRLRAAGAVRPIVVLGSHSAEQVEDAVDLGECIVVFNPAPETGMSRSLRLGLDAVSPGATGALVVHADMPFVRTETIRAVVCAAERGAGIAAPVYRGRRGFPVFFHRSCFPELQRSLSGDAGGRAYIEAHLEDLVGIVVDDPGCAYDIDRPADLAAWKGGRACATRG
jgi:CTP:molybdopterin cytidylyltransferase MocA